MDVKKLVEEGNARMRKFLTEHGYGEKFETYYVAQVGYDDGREMIHCVKKIDSACWLWFEWYWDDDGGEPYIVGSLHASSRLYPDDPFRSPCVRVEVVEITERFLPQIEKYENTLIRQIRLASPAL